MPEQTPERWEIARQWYVEGIEPDSGAFTGYPTQKAVAEWLGVRPHTVAAKRKRSKWDDARERHQERATATRRQALAEGFADRTQALAEQAVGVAAEGMALIVESLGVERRKIDGDVFDADGYPIRNVDSLHLRRLATSALTFQRLHLVATGEADGGRAGEPISVDAEQRAIEAIRAGLVAGERNLRVVK